MLKHGLWAEVRAPERGGGSPTAADDKSSSEPLSTGPSAYLPERRRAGLIAVSAQRSGTESRAEEAAITEERADPLTSYTTLWDWRRQVADLYAALRDMAEAEAAWRFWRARRDQLFAQHPQSPLEPERRRRFTALDVFPYDPRFRFEVAVEEPEDRAPVSMAAGSDGETMLLPFARTRGLARNVGGELVLYWIAGYGGGVFLPFRDATSGATTYAGGRYLLDTIKGADLGSGNGRVVLDFNFAYHPSCSYSDRWACPLAPAANWLPRPVTAGERLEMAGALRRSAG